MSRAPKDEEKLPTDLNLDSDLPPDADIEDKFNDFWKRNGAGIFAGIALAAIAVTGYQTVQYLGERRENNMRAEYRMADSVEAKIAFAERHSGRELAGFAWLELADSAFEANDFSTAWQRYDQAASNLSAGTLLRQRARLGAAQSRLMGGQTEEALRALMTIAANPSYADSIRGEAGVTLAVAEWERGNFNEVSEALEVVLALSNAGFWTFRANELQDRIPQLAQGR
ncbi:MAG: tetratricopeptide repeat protein [Verrucomicrobia bacterium]|nr:tetratricopeptide repeat protein [Verrucomicrobiota bacterium]